MAGKIGWVMIKAMASVWFFAMLAITFMAIFAPMMLIPVGLSYAGYHWVRHLIETFAPEDEDFLTY